MIEIGSLSVIADFRGRKFVNHPTNVSLEIRCLCPQIIAQFSVDLRLLASFVSTFNPVYVVTFPLTKPAFSRAFGRSVP